MTLVRLEIAHGVAVIRLDNPPLNLFTRQLTRALGDVLADVAADDGVRSVVVTGAGTRAFSAGSDIREFPELMERGTVIEDKLAQENAVFGRLARLPQPTIAAIEGVALGGGAELALCCDYRIIGESGRIGLPEIHLGTVPGSGGMARLPRLVNPGTAIALLLDGRPIDARRALEIGLVNEIAAPGRCLEAAIARAQEWAARPGLASRAIKQAVLEASQDRVTAEIEASLPVSRAIFATADMREGVAAFMEKRPPRFQHR
jgi:enoyl-CoA hydratase/carnithine racemase